MAGFEDVFKGGGIVGGIAIGLGVAVMAPILKPILRPVAKSALKMALTAYDQGRVALAELGEQAEDVIAEARSEMGNHHNGHGETASAGTHSAPHISPSEPMTTPSEGTAAQPV